MYSSNSSLFDQENNVSSVVLKAASLLLFIIVGVYGNARVIYTVLVADVLRPVLNIFVASLSIADLVTCIAVMPFPFISLVSGDWVFSQTSCTLHSMLLLYLAHTAALSTCAIVYERYRAIYRKQFPSLSYQHVNVILCVVWILPAVLVASKARQEFPYDHAIGVCLDANEKDKNWSIFFLVQSIAFISLGLLFVLLSFWKILAFLLPIRRRVSPGLLSNEEKLTVAAHARSAWTTIIFVLTYLILVLPLHIVRTVNVERKNAGKSAVADEVIVVFMWLYWLQCAMKPVIYVARSERCASCMCLYLKEIGTGERSNCWWRRNRASIYEVNEISLEKSHSSVYGGRLPAVTPGEFIELHRVDIQQPISRPLASQSSSHRVQDKRVSTNDIIDHSAVIIEDLIMESYIDESQDDTNYSQEKSHDSSHEVVDAIPTDVCHDAVELENIERVLDEALMTQQREWAKKATNKGQSP